MARPKKFRLTPDDVLDPQHAKKLAGHVAEIEFFRAAVEKLQAQIAGVYDAADDDGFDKAIIRKTVARRAKPDMERQAEENAIENYAIAVEKGIATRTREGNSVDHDPITGEILDKAVAADGALHGVHGSTIQSRPTAIVTNSADEAVDEDASEPRPDTGSQAEAIPSASADIQETEAPKPLPEGEASTAPHVETPAEAKTLDQELYAYSSGEVHDEKVHLPAHSPETACEQPEAHGSSPCDGAGEAHRPATYGQLVTGGESAATPIPGIVRFETCPPSPMKRHPFNSMFPERFGLRLGALEDDIRANGVRDPIIKIGDDILDGWARYNIARMLLIEYPVVEYSGSDALADAIRWNVSTHMLTLAECRAIAAKLMKLPEIAHRSAEIASLFGLEFEEAA